MTIKQTVTEKVDEVRLRRPFVDHILRMQKHYSAAQGGMLAGAITYFAFLSIFPMLAIAFAVVGIVAKVTPSAQADLIKGIDTVLPGIVGGANGIKLSTIQSAAGAALGVGGLALLYSGLGWLSNVRTALQTMFEVTPDEKPSFLVGKLKDLLALVTIGVVLVLSVVVSSVITGLSTRLLGWLGLSTGLAWVVVLLGVLVGVASSTLLFFMFFRLLADPPVPARAMWAGGLLGAILFEVLKQISGLLLKGTANSQAFQAFGIALILVVWIYYFSRVLMYAAAFAFSDDDARLAREQEQSRAESEAAANTVLLERKAARAGRPSRAKAFLVGGASTLVALAAVRRRREQA